jgi:hypothetical protein
MPESRARAIVDVYVFSDANLRMSTYMVKISENEIPIQSNLFRIAVHTFVK